MAERLGFKIPNIEKKSPAVWIHAVSVGEVLSLQRLIREIKEQHPEWIVYFSSLTNSGLNMARNKLKEADYLFFIPFDFAWVMRRIFRRLKPDALILVESEFWPNLIRTAKRKSKGIILINGRISSSSFKWYRRFRIIFLPVLKNIDRFLMQTPLDTDRMKEIGVDPEKIEVAGNLKAEMRLAVPSKDDINRMKQDLGISDSCPILIAGSTHKGEEAILLDAFIDSRKKRSISRFILAPRHINRVTELKDLCAARGLVSLCRTEAKTNENWDVLILDTIGELAQMYAIADAAFIGGSLVPWGGQNFLEPAFFAKPIFFGPYMDNFQELAELFISSDAVRRISGKKTLLEFFCLESPEALKAMGERARQTLFTLQGAADKALASIESLLAD